jgi:1-acyl-sn-glycerol-3-phosphate acyltransferase
MNQQFPGIDIKNSKRTFAQRLWYALLRLIGWDLSGFMPDVPKCVVIVAPHTSNWDLPIGFIASRSFNMGFPYWMGKDSIFRWPLGALFRRVGGIPVIRSSSQNYVQQIVDEFARHDHFIFGLAPEGTRTKLEYWKSGFYYIALGAKAPIALGFLDFKRKLAGFGPTFMPTGDVEVDMGFIRRFYSGIVGAHPELQTEARIRPRD